MDYGDYCSAVIRHLDVGLSHRDIASFRRFIKAANATTELTNIGGCWINIARVRSPVFHHFETISTQVTGSLLTKPRL
jgi:hypothetical protein